MLQEIIEKMSPENPWRDRVQFFDTITSTNDVLKQLAQQGAPEGTALVANEQTGGAFTLVPGTHNYRGLLAAYGDLMCENPGGCLKITNCDAAASSFSGS